MSEFYNETPVFRPTPFNFEDVIEYPPLPPSDISYEDSNAINFGHQQNFSLGGFNFGSDIPFGIRRYSPFVPYEYPPVIDHIWLHYFGEGRSFLQVTQEEFQFLNPPQSLVTALTQMNQSPNFGECVSNLTFYLNLARNMRCPECDSFRWYCAGVQDGWLVSNCHACWQDIYFHPLLGWETACFPRWHKLPTLSHCIYGDPKILREIKESLVNRSQLAELPFAHQDLSYLLLRQGIESNPGPSDSEFEFSPKGEKRNSKRRPPQGNNREERLSNKHPEIFAEMKHHADKVKLTRRQKAQYKQMMKALESQSPKDKPETHGWAIPVTLRFETFQQAFERFVSSLPEEITMLLNWADVGASLWVLFFDSSAAAKFLACRALYAALGISSMAIAAFTSLVVHALRCIGYIGNNDSNFPRMHGFDSSPIATLVALALCIIFRKQPGKPRVDAVVASLKDLPLATRGIDLLVSVFEKVIAYIKALTFGEDELTSTMKHIQKRVTYYLSEKGHIEMSRSLKCFSELAALQEKAVGVLLQLEGAQKRGFQSLAAHLNVLYKKAALTPIAGHAHRKRPVTVHIYGSAGCGKTRAINMFSADSIGPILSMDGLEGDELAQEIANFEKYVYFSPAGLKYEQNFNTHYSRIYVCDDANQVEPTSNSDSISFPVKIIHLNNSHDHHLPVAEVEQKKDARFNSALVIATDNQAIPDLSKSITCPKAYHRRLDFSYKMILKPEYSMEISTAGGKLNVVNPESLDPNSVNTHIYEFRDEVNNISYTYEEFVQQIIHKLILVDRQHRNDVSQFKNYAISRSKESLKAMEKFMTPNENQMFADRQIAGTSYTPSSDSEDAFSRRAKTDSECNPPPKFRNRSNYYPPPQRAKPSRNASTFSRMSKYNDLAYEARRLVPEYKQHVPYVAPKNLNQTSNVSCSEHELSSEDESQIPPTPTQSCPPGPKVLKDPSLWNRRYEMHGQRVRFLNNGETLDDGTLEEIQLQQEDEPMPWWLRIFQRDNLTPWWLTQLILNITTLQLYRRIRNKFWPKDNKSKRAVTLLVSALSIGLGLYGIYRLTKKSKTKKVIIEKKTTAQTSTDTLEQTESQAPEPPDEEGYNGGDAKGKKKPPAKPPTSPLVPRKIHANKIEKEFINNPAAYFNSPHLELNCPASFAVQKILCSNAYLIQIVFRQDSDGTLIGGLLRGFFLKDSLFVVNRHLIAISESEWKTAHFNLYNVFDKVLNIKATDVSVTEYTQNDECHHDLIVIDFKKKVSTKLDLFKLLGGDIFLEQKRLKDLERRRVTIFTVMLNANYENTQSGALEIGGKSAWYIEMQHTYIKYVREEYLEVRGPNNEDLYTYNTLEYDMQSVPGYCGSVVIVNDNDYAGRIVGIHMAGSCNGDTSFAQALWSEMFDGYRNKTHLSRTIIGNAEPKTILDLSTFELAGTIPQVMHSSTKSKISKSPIHNKLFETQKKPAHLGFHNGTHVVNTAMLKYLEPSLALNSENLSIFYGFLKSTFNPTRKLAEFDLETAIRGIPGSAYVLPINRSSSAGYPLCLETKRKGKTEFLGSDENYIVDHPRVIEEINDYILCASSGEDTKCYFVVTSKDELRLIQKVEEGKTRCFAAVPLAASIVMRQKYLDISANVMEERIGNSSLIGINCYSTEWDQAARKLLSVAPPNANQFIAGDFSNFDGSLNRDFLWKIYQFLEECYGRSGDRVTEAIWRDLLESKQIFGNAIFKIVRGHPSGHPLTALLNTLYNAGLVYVVLYRILEEIGTLESFSIQEQLPLHYSALYYGDDNCIAFSRQLAEVIPPSTLPKMMSVFGHKYTTDTKDGSSFEYKTLSEVSILKRRFLRDETNWYAPLELVSIMEPLNWDKIKPGKVEAKRQQLASNMRIAIRELSLHPSSTFEEWRAKITSTAQDERIALTPDCYYEQRILRDSLKRDADIPFMYADTGEIIRSLFLDSSSAAEDSVDTDYEEDTMSSEIMRDTYLRMEGTAMAAPSKLSTPKLSTVSSDPRHLSKD
jgi:hypothetical protein